MLLPRILPKKLHRLVENIPAVVLTVPGRPVRRRFIGHENIRTREIICRTQAPYKIPLKDGSPPVNVQGVV